MDDTTRNVLHNTIFNMSIALVILMAVMSVFAFIIGVWFIGDTPIEDDMDLQKCEFVCPEEE